MSNQDVRDEATQGLPPREETSQSTQAAPRGRAAAGDPLATLIATLRHNAFGILILIAGIVVLWLTVPNFLTTNNVLTILQQVSIVGIVSIGMVFVVLTSGIDLSVGSALALTGVLFSKFVNSGIPPWLSVIVAVAIGAGFGLANGIGIVGLLIQPFVMTLATLAIGAGVALSLSNGSEILTEHTDGFVNFLGNGGIGSFPGAFVVFALVAAVGWLVTRYTTFGRHVYAVGANAETARLSGIRVRRVLLAVYVIVGACAGLAGVMTTAQLGAGEPTAGSLTNLQAIAAVVIGGVSLFGGRGGVIGGVIGAFVLAIIANVLVLRGVSPYSSQTIQGIVIIAAVLIGSREARVWLVTQLRAGAGRLRDA